MNPSETWPELATIETIPHQEEITLQAGKSETTIQSQGLRIPKLTLDGLQVFWSGKRPDGNFASTHPAVPFFGPWRGKVSDDLSIPGQHGPGRKEMWKIFNAQPEVAQTIFKTDTLKGIYHPELLTYCTVALQPKQFWQVFSFENRSQNPQSWINPGLHWYWKNGGSSLSEIQINGERFQESEWAEAKILKAKSENEIIIPNLGAFGVKTNLENLILWSQIPDEGESEFACIELGGHPEKIGEQTDLKPGEFRHFHGGIRLIENLRQ